MATAAELREQAKAFREKAIEADREAHNLRDQARQMEREERRDKARREQMEHMNRMFSEIGQPLAGLNEEQHGLVYAVAWEHGHASGFSDVENYYGDFAELARKLLAAR